MITVVFRYDDFSARSDSALERRLIDLFQRYRIPCVFGVVPFVCAGDERDPAGQEYCELPADKVALLHDGVASGTIEPALHGFHHQNYNKVSGGRLSEFAGLSIEEQVRRLRAGKEWLERICGKCVETFIPPFNAYDLNTLEALGTAGFRIMSAAMFDVVGPEVTVALMPHSCSLLQVHDAVERARRLHGSDVALIPLFHPFDFVESDRVKGRIDLDRFEELLIWLKKQPDIETTHFSALAAAHYDVPRFIANRLYLRLALHPLALPWWQGRYPRTQYLPGPMAKSFFRKMTFYSVLVYFGIVGTFLMIGMALSHVGAAVPVRIVSVSAVAAVLMIWLARGKRMYFKTFVLLLALSGVAVGSWL